MCLEVIRSCCSHNSIFLNHPSSLIPSAERIFQCATHIWLQSLITVDCFFAAHKEEKNDKGNSSGGGAYRGKNTSTKSIIIIYQKLQKVQKSFTKSVFIQNMSDETLAFCLKDFLQRGNNLFKKHWQE